MSECVVVGCGSGGEGSMADGLDGSEAVTRGVCGEVLAVMDEQWMCEVLPDDGTKHTYVHTYIQREMDSCGRYLTIYIYIYIYIYMCVCV